MSDIGPVLPTLVPCPICGGTSGYELARENEYWNRVACSDCGAHIGDAVISPDACGSAPLGPSANEVWNGAGAYGEHLRREIVRLNAAIRKTLAENGHLADGENCTLIELKRAIGEMK